MICKRCGHYTFIAPGYFNVSQAANMALGAMVVPDERLEKI